MSSLLTNVGQPLDVYVLDANVHTAEVTWPESRDGEGVLTQPQVTIKRGQGFVHADNYIAYLPPTLDDTADKK